MQKFADTKTTAKYFDLSVSALKAMRLGHLDRPACLIEGVHWFRFSKTKVLFNLALIEDYLQNKSNPGAHEIAIDTYLRSLPSSQV